MFPVECTIEGLGVRLPDVCPCEPVTSGSAFCASHMQVALEKGCPTSVKGFLQFCGASKETGMCALHVYVHSSCIGMCFCALWYHHDTIYVRRSLFSACSAWSCNLLIQKGGVTQEWPIMYTCKHVCSWSSRRTWHMPRGRRGSCIATQGVRACRKKENTCSRQRWLFIQFQQIYVLSM